MTLSSAWGGPLRWTPVPGYSGPAPIQAPALPGPATQPLPECAGKHSKPSATRNERHAALAAEGREGADWPPAIRSGRPARARKTDGRLKMGNLHVQRRGLNTRRGLRGDSDRG